MRRYVHDQLFIHSEAAQLRHGLSWMNRLMVTTILAAILLTVLASEETLFQPHRSLFIGAEMVFGGIFGIEYLARVWAVITLTAVGYGDVSPVTPLGKLLASLVAMSGIGLVAMPTGIMAAAFSDAMQRRRALNDPTLARREDDETDPT